MIELKIKTNSGGDADSISIDEAQLGTKIKKRLMHSAVIMYHANSRQGSASTRSRGEIAGTTRKMYRQKGTGRARMGTRKSGIRVGGGRIFGPKPRDFGYAIPKKMRRGALKSALLAKLKDEEVVAVDSFGLSRPRTKDAVKLLENLGLTGKKILLATADEAREVFLSARNIAGVTVKRARDINTLDVLQNKILLIERDSLLALVTKKLSCEKAKSDDDSGTDEAAVTEKTESAGEGSE